MHYYVEPEISGGIGASPIMDNSCYPPIAKKLNYEFDGWLGDDIIESFPCFVISKNLKSSPKSIVSADFHLPKLKSQSLRGSQNFIQINTYLHFTGLRS